MDNTTYKILNDVDVDITRIPRSFLSRFMSRWRFIALIQAFDFAIFLFISFHWLWAISHPAMRHWWLVHLLVSLMIAATIHQVFQNFHLYNFDTLLDVTRSIPRAFIASIMATAPLSVMLFTRPDLSIDFIISACGLTLVGLLIVTSIRLPIARVAVAWLQSGVVNHRHYLIANTHQAIVSLQNAFKISGRSHVIGTFVLPEDDNKVEQALINVCAFLRDHAVDAIILKLPLSQPDRIDNVVKVLRCVPRQILLAPTFEGTDGRLLPQKPDWRRSSSTQGMVLVKLNDRPLAGWRWVLKDMQDRLIALLLLILLSPIMIAAAVAVKFSDAGPIFFLQRRIGYGGNTFSIFKFRTMRVLDGASRYDNTLKLTTRNDPRIFPIGGFLRKTSIDELPQLLNVLRGDMWIVGPRPHSPLAQAGGQVYAEAVKEYGARYRLKPGITGWAQVSGWRGPTDTIEQLKGRVECDLYYVENWSMWFDARILVRTLTCAFGHENAF